jgi:hypothetical protein
MYATSRYSSTSYNSQIGHGHSGQYCQQLKPPIQRRCSGQQRPYASTPYVFSGLYNANTPTQSTLNNPNRSRVTSAGGRLLSVLLPCTRRQSGGPNNRLRRKSISRTTSDSSSRMDPGAPAHISYHDAFLVNAIFSFMRFIKTTFSCR